jgi:LacI family transcriptional regulator
MERISIEKWKHRQIYEHIHAAIVRGEFTPGDRLPTDNQLMRKFGTSRPTVARAMRDLEIAGLLERRPGAGSFVRVASVPVTRPLGILIPQLDRSSIFGPMCGEITRAAQRHGFHVFWTTVPEWDARGPAEPMQQLCRQFIEQKLAGVFFAPIEFAAQREPVNRETAESLDQAGIAVVLLDRDLTAFPNRSKFDLVGVDNYRIGYLQTEYLLGLGCRQILHVALPGSAPTVDARTEGYRQALRVHGVRAKESWIRRGNPSDVQFVENLTRPMPDAVICANDWTAASLMRTLCAIRVRVPQDVRIVGVDDDEYAQLLTTSLTTVRQPSREIGAAAVRAMIQRIENPTMPPRDVLVACQLVVRESTGGAAASPERGGAKTPAAVAERRKKN